MSITMVAFVFLSAGKGTRLWPITETAPKTMVRVMGKPIIEWGVEAAVQVAEKVVLVVGADGGVIRDHFAGKPYAEKLEFVAQAEQKGTGHACLTARNAVNGPFIVLNGDTFYNPSFYALAAAEALKGTPFIVGKMVEDASPSGLLQGEGGLLKGIIEKPQPPGPGVIFTGCYFAQPDFFSYLERLSPSPRGELEVTDALCAYARDRQVRILEHTGYWNDVGYYWNYLDTSLYCLENIMPDSRTGKVDEFVTIEGKVFIGKGSRILAGTFIEGPVFIGVIALSAPGLSCARARFSKGATTRAILPR